MSRKSLIIKIHSLDAFEDRIWSFHVWTECYFKRRDLDKNGFYDGWQVIDGTPLIKHASRILLGPSPVIAVKYGHRVKYDTPFVYSEVSGRYFVYQFVKEKNTCVLSNTLND